MGRSLGILLAVVVALAALVGAALWFGLDRDDAPSAAGADGAAAGVAQAGRGGTAVRAPEVPARVTGEVRRASDGTPVAGLRVVLEGVRPRDRETETDARGAFEFAAVPRGGPYTVVADAPGAAVVRVPGIELRPGDARDVGTLWIAPAVRVLVEVTAFDGTPLSGVSVEAFRVADGAAAFESGFAPAAVETVTTGGDGVAGFPGLPVGTWTFVASRPGYSRRGTADEQLEAGDGERTFRIALERGWRIEGRVLSRAGEPVAGAAVVALRRTLSTSAASAPLTCRTVSDAEGRYALDSLPAADVCIWASWPQGLLAIVAAVRPPGVPYLDLTLPDPSYVTGHVTETDTGAPVPGAIVTASYSILGGISQQSSAATDATGAYRVIVPMRASLGGLAAQRDGFLPGTDPHLVHESLEVPEGATLVRDLSLRRGAALEGLVRGPDGPVAGASVTVEMRDHGETVTAGRDGRYRFVALPAGPALVRASRRGLVQKDVPPDASEAIAAGRLPVACGVEVPAQGGATLDVELAAGGLSLRGTVKDAAGGPIAGARITVAGDETFQPAVSDAEGRFEVRALDPGASVDLRASREGWLAAEESVDVPAAGETSTVEFVLRRPARVRGRVRSADGRPLAGAYVQLGDAFELEGVPAEWQSLSMQRHPVAADGSFDVELTEVRDEVCVHAAAEGCARASSSSVPVAADGTPPWVELVLGPAHAVSGVVRSVSGAPIAGANVAAFPRAGPDDDDQECVGAWGPAIVAVTDAAGRFAVKDLAPGWWGFAAWSETALRARTIAEVPAAGEVVVTLQPSLAIGGTLVYDDGAPVAGAEVAVSGPSQGDFRAVTDARGAFRVAGLAEGAHQLRAVPGAMSSANFLPAEMDDVTAGTSGVVFTVRRALSIRGKVRWSDGAPAAGVAISVASAEESDRNPPTAYARADGSFEALGVGVGRWSLTVCGERRGDWLRCVWDGVAAGAADLEFVIPRRAAVSARIVDEAGAPVAGVEIRIDMDASGPAAGRDASGTTLTTGDDGEFSFQGLEGTRYWPQIIVSDGVTLADPEPLRPGTGHVVLVAKTGESVAGTATDAEGRPLAGVLVTAAVPPGLYRRCVVAADGSFEVRGLAPETSYELCLVSEDLLPGEAVTAKSGTRGLKLHGARGLEATGRILSPSGEPLGSAEFWIEGPGGERRDFMTREDGTFHLVGLPPGEWKVTVGLLTSNEWRPVPAGTLRAGERDVTLRAQ